MGSELDAQPAMVVRFWRHVAQKAGYGWYQDKQKNRSSLTCLGHVDQVMWTSPCYTARASRKCKKHRQCIMILIKDYVHKCSSVNLSIIIKLMRKNSFSKDFRLVKSAQFTEVFKNGARSSDAFFTVLCAKNDSCNNSLVTEYRLGLAISKKTAHRAVDRNRIKRIVRESFRLARTEWTENRIDIVVLARRAAVQTNNRVLVQSLQKHWQKLFKVLSQSQSFFCWDCRFAFTKFFWVLTWVDIVAFTRVAQNIRAKP